MMEPAFRRTQGRTPSPVSGPARIVAAGGPPRKRGTRVGLSPTVPSVYDDRVDSMTIPTTEAPRAMKIILANPRGFCAGVNMAIESLERALDLFGTPLYVYHEIVHNRPVVERFRRRGVVFVDDLSEVPCGATVLYSAHGVAPLIRKTAAERRL